MVLRSNETSQTWRYLFRTILQNESWNFCQNLTVVTFGSEIKGLIKLWQKECLWMRGVKHGFISDIN